MGYKIFGEWKSSRRNNDSNYEDRGFEVEVDSIQSSETNIAEMSYESLNFWLTKFIAGVYREWRALSAKKFVQYLLWIAASFGKQEWKRRH